MFKIFLDRKTYLFLLIAFFGGFITFYFNQQLQDYEFNKRKDELSNAHEVVVGKFSESLSRFAYLMSGMKSHLHYTESFPTQEELQDFLIYQTKELNFNDSLIVSFLNPNHEFIYSFTKNQLDPGGLIGTSVRSFRNDAEIERLDSLLQKDRMKLFPPINLVEGWVGIPLNFPVFRDGESVGYVASILNFRNIIEPIYNLGYSEVFAFRFSAGEDVFFDREQVHDNSKIYHDRIDPKYFENYEIDPDQFISSKVTAYGLTFNIGTAYISDQTPNPYLRWAFFVIYGLIFISAGFAIYRYTLYKQLNEKLNEVNSVIETKNKELQETNATKNRLMSIIGHDLKGPISSIINLISLVEDSAISLSDTKNILKQLNPVAKNTINLLENLLQWAMVNSDQTLYRPKLLIINDIVNENYDLLKSLAEQKNITLFNSVNPALTVMADPNMFSTIIRNLVSNAIKYSENGSQVKVSARSENKHIIIDVEDQGVGMSAKEIYAINNLELEASKKGTAGEKGTGLGLTLCKAFISKHGGSLEISSKKGNGSTFSVILPS